MKTTADKARSGKELANRKDPLSTKGLSDEEIQNLGLELWGASKKLDPKLKVTMKNDKGDDIAIEFPKASLISPLSVGDRGLIPGGYSARHRATGTELTSSVFARITLDGNLAYCVQPGVLVVVGEGYSPQTSFGGFAASQNDRINKLLNFGAKDGAANSTYVATQALVWDAIGWDVRTNHDHNSEITAISNAVNNFDTTPSVADQTITVKEGQTGGSITDTTGVLQNYHITSNTTNATVTQNGNTINATLPIGADDGGEITLIRDGTGSGTFYYWVKENSQTIATRGIVEPKTIKLKIKATRLTPSIGTTATDKETGSKTPSPEKEITIVDTVKYSDLTPGKEYTLKGTLMDKSTGLPLKVKGKDVTSEVTFTAENETGTVELEFTFDALALANKEVVAFEKLYTDNTEVAVHTDINDEGQTVKFRNPEIGTTATDKETGTKTPAPEKNVTIVDNVTYKDLIPGKEYTMKGILMDKKTNSPLLVNGKKITAEKTFTPESDNGTVELEFTFDAKLLADKEVVVFENLYRNDNLVISHADINDEGQTVTFTNPKIKTTATDKNSGTKQPDADDQVTVVDLVQYTDLIPDKEYTLKGVLMSKKTNKPLRINGKKITAEKTFTPTEKSGSIELEFTFDASALVGQELVVFEDLYRRGEIVISHADINDQGQTVKVKTPIIKTTATDKETGSKTPAPAKSVTIVDKVMYKDLIPGKEYTIKGILMNKSTNKPLLVKGQKVRAEKTFTPATRTGSITLEFTFDASALNGQEVVVFENLYRNDILVVSHSDINDKNQTVKITDKTSTPKTGDENNFLPMLIGIALLSGSVIAISIYRKVRS